MSSLLTKEDLVCNDTQIGLMKPEICTKVLRNQSENLGAKFPATSFNYSMIKIARLDDPFSEILEASPAEVL